MKTKILLTAMISCLLFCNVALHAAEKPGKPGKRQTTVSIKGEKDLMMVTSLFR